MDSCIYIYTYIIALAKKSGLEDSTSVPAICPSICSIGTMPETRRFGKMVKSEYVEINYMNQFPMYDKLLLYILLYHVLPILDILISGEITLCINLKKVHFGL